MTNSGRRTFTDEYKQQTVDPVRFNGLGPAPDLYIGSSPEVPRHALMG